MKNLSGYAHTHISIFILGIMVITLSGCWGEKYTIESPKVPNAEEVSNSCAQNLGLSDTEKEELVNELKNNDRKFNDEFKLQAMIIISESNRIPTQERDAAQAAYFSCIENSINAGSSK